MMFGQSVPKSWYFSGSVQTEALNRLMYVAEQGESFVLLQGERGSGKSTLLTQVKAECSRLGHSAILISLAALDQNSFLWHLCGGLSIVPRPEQSRSELMAAVRDEIAGRTLCHHKTVLLLDDVHRAGEDPLPLIQFLSAINQQNDTGVTVIAAAGGDLSQELQSLSALRVALPLLNADQSRSFVQESLKAAGVNPSVVSDDAVTAVANYGQGSPGRLARVCEVLKIASTTNPESQIDAAAVSALTRETLLADVA